MKTLTETEAVATRGGTSLFTLAGLLYTVAGALATHAAKDIYDHWDEFKAAVADGWNHV